MKNRNVSNLKYYILGALFVVTAVITFITMNYQSASYSSTVMTQATLPIVTMETESGMQFNRLHGYTRDMDVILSNYSLTPLVRDKKLPINIHTYGQAVTAISYKVRDLSDKSLIENTKVSDFTVEGDNVSAQLNIKNLIDDNKQYLLQVIVSTENHDAINYYTKIISGQDYQIDDKLDFVLDFNKATFSQETIGTVTKYLETVASGNTNNFGKIDIKANQTLLGWGNLDPFVQSDIIPNIQDINSETAIVTLDYSMGAKNDYDSYDTYNVDEYYRVRQVDAQMYLLNYERSANQVFDSRSDLTSSSKINLGITSDTNVVYKESANKDYLYFINQGSLWCFNATNNEFTQVFSFGADDESDNTREAYTKHDFKIIDVTDEGDCQFLLNGYMNRGAHEGEVGVSLYNYSYANNVVDEKAFIPINASYDAIKDIVGGIAYVKDNNIFYITINDKLYAIDLTSKEIMTEISDLKEGTYAVSPSRKAIAYSMNGDLDHTNQIRIFDVSQSNDFMINADEGDSLRVIGYINDDLVYGIAHNDDILEDENGSTIFPMYKICIMNSSYEEVKDYQQDGIYISEAEVNKLRVNLSRVVKDGSGGYQSISIDQLINKDENANDSEVSIDTFSTEDRLQETLIVLSKAIKNTSTVSMRTSKEVVFKENSEIQLDGDIVANNRYYVYGYGLFQGSYASITAAVSKANATYGYVVDADNRVIWNKYRSNSGSIKGISVNGGANSLATALDAVIRYDGHQANSIDQLSTNRTAIDILNDNLNQHALYLKGASIDYVLHFINTGYPVIAKLGEDHYGIIIAYDTSNITYIDAESGSSETKSIAEATTLFAQNDNVFLTYYK